MTVRKSLDEGQENSESKLRQLGHGRDTPKECWAGHRDEKYHKEANDPGAEELSTREEERRESRPRGREKPRADSGDRREPRGNVRTHQSCLTPSERAVCVPGAWGRQGAERLLKPSKASGHSSTGANRTPNHRKAKTFSKIPCIKTVKS